MLSGCTSKEGPEGVQAGLLLSEVTYQASWDWGGAKPDPGGGWSVTNDLGFRVYVSEGVLVFYALQLSPCGAAFARAAGLPGVASAHAGHGDPLDPSVLPSPWVVSLADPAEPLLTTVSFKPQRYCEVDLLLARADTSVPDLPDALIGVSLSLKGTWTAPDAPTSVPFDIKTSIAHSGRWELASALSAGSGPRAIVQLRHQLGGLFDQVDFRDQSDALVLRDVLTNAVAQTQLTVVLAEQTL